MSSKLNLRARFPDGKTETLLGVSCETSYKELLKELKMRAELRSLPERVLVGGPPPRAIECTEETKIGDILKTGDSLIVEPVGRTETAGPAARRGRRSKRTMVEKAQAKLKGRETKPPSKKRGRVATLTDIGGKRGKASRRVGDVGEVEADDDAGDKDWEEGASDQEDENGDEVQAVKTGAKRRSKRTRRVAGGGQGLGDGGFDPLGIRGAEEGLGVALVQSLVTDPGKLDVTGKKFKESLQSALAERQAESAGERRYASWLGGKYRLESVADGAGFTVEVKEADKRGWVKDMDGAVVVAYEKDVLKGAFEEVLKGENSEEDRERLRAAEMAKVSPRIFWNMVRLFPDGVEEGLRTLVPQADWEFLQGRRQFLTAKGKRNVENKEVLGWESD